MSNLILDLSVNTKSFDGVHVLDNIHFELSAGEVVSLVGASGCGKSTLLRIVAGLDRDFDGAVNVAGEPARVHSGHVGFIFQEPRLLPWLTVAENVGFEAGPKGAAHPRVAELLEDVGLSDFANAYPKQLSGGMAQRASIARGLFNQPQLLLLDEPFSAVDAFTKMRLQDLLLNVAARHRTTVLLVTHDIDEAVYLSNRVLVMTSKPGAISHSVSVDIPHQRDRRDVRLAELKSTVLTLLNEGMGKFQGVSVEAQETARQLIQRVKVNRFSIAS